MTGLRSGGRANVVRQTLCPLEHGRDAGRRLDRQVAPEAVAHAAHGFEQVLVAGGLEGLAQAADVHVDGTLFHVDVVAPDLVEQLRAAIDAAGWVMRIAAAELRAPRSSLAMPTCCARPGSGAGRRSDPMSACWGAQRRMTA